MKTLVALFFCGFSAQAILPTRGRPEAPEGFRFVPEVRGKERVLALQVLRLADLRGAWGTMYIAPQNWRADLKPRFVGLQTPQPETFVPPDTVVALWTFARAGANQKIVTMPALAGKSRVEATVLLRDSGLKLIQQVEADTFPDERSGAATVIDHYPRAGQKVYEGTSVFLQFQPVQGNQRK